MLRCILGWLVGLEINCEHLSPWDRLPTTKKVKVYCLKLPWQLCYTQVLQRNCYGKSEVDQGAGEICHKLFLLTRTSPSLALPDSLSGSLWLTFRLSLVPTGSLFGTLAFKGTLQFILLGRGPGTTIWSKLHLIDLQVGILRLDSMHPPISSSAKILENCPIVFRPAIIIGVCKLSVSALA